MSDPTKEKEERLRLTKRGRVVAELSVGHRRIVVGGAADAAVRLKKPGIPDEVLVFDASRRPVEMESKLPPDKVFLNGWAVSKGPIRPGDKVEFLGLTVEYVGVTDVAQPSVVARAAEEAEATHVAAQRPSLADAVAEAVAPQNLASQDAATRRNQDAQQEARKRAAAASSAPPPTDPRRRIPISEQVGVLPKGPMSSEPSRTARDPLDVIGQIRNRQKRRRVWLSVAAVFGLGGGVVGALTTDWPQRIILVQSGAEVHVNDNTGAAPVEAQDDVAFEASRVARLSGGGKPPTRSLPRRAPTTTAAAKTKSGPVRNTKTAPKEDDNVPWWEKEDDTDRVNEILGDESMMVASADQGRLNNSLRGLDTKASGNRLRAAKEIGKADLASISVADQRASMILARRDDTVSRAGGGYDTGSDASREAGSAQVSGDAIGQAMRGRYGAVKDCLVGARFDRSDARVVVSFTLHPTGKVSGVQIEQSDISGARFGSCLTSVISRTSFPRPKSDSVSVTYPFVFTRR